MTDAAERAISESELGESGGRRRIGPDYDSVDLRSSEVIQGLLDNLQRRSREILPILAEGDPYAHDPQQVLNLTKELLETDRTFGRTADQALARNEKHPLWPYIEKQKQEGLLDLLVQELEKQVIRLSQAKQEREESEKRISGARKAAAEQKRAAETSLTALRQRGEETIKKLEGLFGLGLLPAARRRNTERLKQARALLSHLGAIEEGIATPYLRRTDLNPDDLEVIKKAQGELKEAASKARQTELDGYALSREEERIKNLWSSMRDSLEKILTELKLTGEGQKPREELLSKVEAAAREMEQFENQVLEIFFRPLSITTEDEERALAEPLPEAASPAVEKARERSFRNLRQMIRNFVVYYAKRGRTMEQIAADLAPHFERVQQTAFISFNDKGGEMLEVLKSGNILSKNLLPPEKRRVSHTAAGAWDARRQNELSLGFGKEEYPIYTALGSSLDAERGAAPFFGGFHLSFPLESFWTRASCTLGDSHNDEGVPHSLRRPGPHRPEDAASRQLTLQHAIIIKALFDIDLLYEPKVGASTGFFQPLSFVEVQISGPINTSGAGEVVVSPANTLGEITHLQKNFGDAANMVKELSAAAEQGSGREIPVRISSSQPPGDPRQYYNGPAYEQFYRPAQAAA